MQFSEVCGKGGVRRYRGHQHQWEKWFSVLYLYQSVCQSSTLLQRHQRGERGENLEEKKGMGGKKRHQRGQITRKPRGTCKRNKRRQGARQVEEKCREKFEKEKRQQ